MPGELPQGTITILFTDVVGSTALTTSRGDEPAHDILRHQRELVRAQVQLHSGHEVKSMGDGFMVVFASARQATTCAIGIQRAMERHGRQHPDDPVKLKVGLNTGEAIHEEGDVFGSAVTAAERIMSKASGGQIFVSESVRAVLGQQTDVAMVDRGRFRLKGFPDRWRIYEVVWREAPQAARAAIDRIPFVRRDPELAQLRRALDGAIGGRGALVMIGGEPGVGKTRLAEELVAGARKRGVLAFVGRSYEDAGAPPFGPFIEILEAAARTIPAPTLRRTLGDSLPDVARVLPALWRLSPETVKPAEPAVEVARHQVFGGIREFLANASGENPVLLFLDDLHWADDASVQLLRHLARTLRELPVMVVATYRDDRASTGASLGQALDEWHRRRLAQWITLHAFSMDDVRALLFTLNGEEPPSQLVTALLSETSGNAFFIEEMLRQLADEPGLFDDSGRWREDVQLDAAALPHSVSLVIRRRIDRLGEPARGVLAAGAIGGRSFDAGLLEHMLSSAGGLMEALDEAERAGLVIAEGSNAVRWRFAHPLTRTVLISGLTASQRQRLHVDAALASEAIHGGAPEHAAEMAQHYLSAGALADPARTVAALRLAGEHAEQARASLEADAFYTEALRLSEQRAVPDDRALAELLHHLGRVKYSRALWSESNALIDRAIAICRKIDATSLLAELLYSKAALSTWDARASDAIEHLAEAKQYAEGNDRLIALILQLEGQNQVQLRQYGRAREAIDQAVGIAERLDDPYVTTRVHMASGYWALSALDMVRAAADFERTSSSTKPTDVALMASESRRAMALACLGQLEQAEQQSAAARAFFSGGDDDPATSADPREHGDPYEFGIACIGAAVAAIARCRFADARGMLQEAIESAGSPPNVWVVRTLIPMFVQALHESGRSDEAQEWIRRYLTGADGARPPVFARIYAAIANDTLETQGQGVTLPAPPAHMPDLQSLAVTVIAAEAALVMRDADAAGRQLDAIRHLHERGMEFTNGWVVLVPRLLGALCALRSDYEDARRYLGLALERASAAGALAELALAHLELADLDAACGPASAGSARTHLASARRYLTEAGAAGHDRRLRQVAERVGGEVAAAVQLTEEDADILRMIAAGMTNRRIARGQAQSEGVVQRRLSRLYEKLGVADRAAAIAYAHRNGIVPPEH